MGRILAIIGGGGKTTSMCALSQYLKQDRVLMTTTTHILPVLPPASRVFLPDPSEQVLLQALSEPGIVCAGIPEDKNGRTRLCSLDSELLQKAAGQADWVICEADGANRRPLKLHRETEPVMPENTERCLIVVGLSSLGQPVSEKVHRYERNPQWAENPNQAISFEDIAYCIRENIAVTGLPADRIYVLLNQADTLASPELAESCTRSIQKLGVRCMAGSMQSDPIPIIKWILK